MSRQISQIVFTVMMTVVALIQGGCGHHLDEEPTPTLIPETPTATPTPMPCGFVPCYLLDSYRNAQLVDLHNIDDMNLGPDYD